MKFMLLRFLFSNFFLLPFVFFSFFINAQEEAATSSSSKELTLLLWNIPRKDSSNVEDKANREVFDLFLRRHPHIKVKILVPLKIQGRGAEGNQFLAIAGGMAPDVFDLFGRKVGDYIDQGFLAPLNERFKKDFKEQGKEYFGVEAPDSIWELCIKDGNIYAVPMAYYFMALQYRKDLFIKAGLDPSKPPKDWDEMWEMGKKLTFIPSKEPGVITDQLPTYGFNLLRGQFQGWHFLQFIWAAGGEVVACYKECPVCKHLTEVSPPYFNFNTYGIHPINFDDYQQRYYGKNEKCSHCNASLEDVTEYKWRLVCNDQGGVAALEYYRKLASQPWLRCFNEHEKREFDITPEMFKTGSAVCPVCGAKYDLNSEAVKRRIYHGIARSSVGTSRGERFETAMGITTMGAVTNVDLTQWSLTAFPPRKGCEPKSFVAGWYYGINKTSPPENQEAAWQYIKFMTSEEAIHMRVKAMVENGMAQYVRPYLLKKYGYMDYYRELPEEWITVNESVTRSTKVEPYCRGFTHVMTVSLGHPMDMAILYPEANAKELMDKVCDEVNSTILGKRPEKVMQRYKRISYIAITIVAVLIACAFVFIVKHKMKEHKTIDTYIPGLSPWRRTIYAWSFLSIAVISIAIWQYYPLLRGSIMAFQDFKILGGGHFVGTQNFIEVILETNFWQFLFQTFYYVFLSIAMGFLVPIILAILLTEIPKGSMIFRVIYYLPAVTTGLVTMFLWKQLLFDPTPDGIINWILSFFDIPPQTFLEDPSLAMICIIIPGIWAHAGPGCLIYLAALKCIPEEQYEAADLDGAGFLHKFWHVLVPNLKALIMINFLGAFVGAFQASENIFVMTGGGPVNKTMTIGLDIWYHSFLYLNFGFATAEAWILGAMLIGFTVVQLQILSKVEFKRAGNV